MSITIPIQAHQEHQSGPRMDPVRVGKKRNSSDSSETHAEAPKTKKRKKSSKQELLSPLETGTAPILPPPPPPPLVSKSFVPDKKTDGSKKSSLSGLVEPEDSQVASQSSSHTDATASKTLEPAKKRTIKRNYLKPHNGSWMTHMASMVVHKCVTQAVARCIDPRGHLNEINWEVMSERLLSGEDMKMLWYYIKKEYPDNTPLPEIATMLLPYARLTVDQFVREDIKLKYKDQVPKQPLSAYMLFTKSKGPKLKAKHPELSQTEMAVKLGKKWKSMGSERQEKYKQQYVTLRKSYETQLEQFYSDHPDAKLPRISRASKQKRKMVSSNKPELTPEEKRLKELKLLMPKAPATAYFLFCKAKRGKLQKKHPELSSIEVTAKLGRKWKSMTEEGKAKYKRAYEENARLYHQQLEEFHAQNPDAKELLAKKKKKGAEASKDLTSTSTQTSPAGEQETVFSPIPEEPKGHTEEEGEEEEQEEESERELELDMEKGQNGASPGTADSSEDSNSEEL